MYQHSLQIQKSLTVQVWCNIGLWLLWYPINLCQFRLRDLERHNPRNPLFHTYACMTNNNQIWHRNPGGGEECLQGIRHNSGDSPTYAQTLDVE